ncbi:hypothetical protein BC343_01270 [Mucilaginibacter pedocola]|uniref:Internalin n=1 Tax=Mucilaginibacter pedocola TaxID=1792845 RepID=A0A1S9PLB4_9SPHI|nr:hypothetical protein BC343_01270 [Mucilaginibacter pedocola]
MIPFPKKFRCRRVLFKRPCGDVGACYLLASIEDISHLVNLRSLNIDTCRAIKNYQVLSALVNLEELKLTDCGKIDSISFLNSLKKIKTFRLLADVNILDGDLTPAQHIEKVFCRPRKHYNMQLDKKAQGKYR